MVTWSTSAGALTAAISAIAALITSISVLLKARRIDSKVDEVHVLVNSQLTRVVDLAESRGMRVGQLTNALEASRVPVPVDPDEKTLP